MRDIKCRNCFNYRNKWCEKVIDSPAPDMVRDCRYFREKTNADHIRAMTDEELEETFHAGGLCSYIQANHNAFCEARGACTNCVLEWLKQPYEEEV